MAELHTLHLHAQAKMYACVTHTKILKVQFMGLRLCVVSSFNINMTHIMTDVKIAHGSHRYSELIDLKQPL